MQWLRRNLDTTIWTRNLMLFAAALFLARFGQGLLGGARMNFFVDTLGLDQAQVLWLEGIREIPGLALIFIGALTMAMPITRQAALAVFLMGAGYLLYAFVGSYTALIVAVLVASFGFHLWTPLNHALGLTLSTKENAGQVLGTLSSVSSLASIAGMGAIALISLVLREMPLTNYYLVGSFFVMVASILIWRLPRDIGDTDRERPRIVLRRRYWLYYVLIFFSGARKLVLGSFITLLLVQDYGIEVWQVSTLTLVAGLLNIVLAPRLGKLIDTLGERVTTPIAYTILALCCIGFALVPNLIVLMALWVLIKVAAPLGMGLQTYVYRTAPPEELTPTLTAGVTFDHISSVSMPFLAGALLPVIDYTGIFLAAAALILVSIPFARVLQVQAAGNPAR